MFYGMEYPYGQFIAVLAMLPPIFSCKSSGTELETLKSPWLWASIAKQQPKHQCVTNITLTLKLNNSNVPLTKKKINFIPAKIRTTLTYLSVNSYKVLLITEAFMLSFIFYSFNFNECTKLFSHNSSLFVIGPAWILWQLCFKTEREEYKTIKWQIQRHVRILFIIFNNKISIVVSIKPFLLQSPKAVQS